MTGKLDKVSFFSLVMSDKFKTVQSSDANSVVRSYVSSLTIINLEAESFNMNCKLSSGNLSSRGT